MNSMPSPRGAGVLVAVVVLLMLVATPHPMRAASAAGTSAPVPAVSTSAPATAGPIIIDTGDSRSNGQGPGLVGSPFAIVIGVVLLGLIAAGATLLYLRVADRR